MAKNKQNKPAALPRQAVSISASTLQIAHQCIARVPAGNAQQAVAIANALMEIEAAMQSVGVVAPEAEEAASKE